MRYGMFYLIVILFMLNVMTDVTHLEQVTVDDYGELIIPQRKHQV